MDGVMEYVALGNAILLAAVVAVWLFEAALKLTRLRHAYKLRLNLAVAALSAAALPFILAPLGSMMSSLVSVNATDLLVSQFLKGNIGITATQLSNVIDAKDGLLTNLANTASWTSVAVVSLFLIAAVLRGAYIAINIVRVYGLVQRSKPHHDSKRVSIRISDEIDVPLSTRGLYRYFIIIPEAMMGDSRALQIAVGHEAQHIRQRDVDWEILLSLVSPVFALNPAFWLISDRIRRYREYSCDAMFLRNRRFDAKEYCMLLLEIASKANRKRMVGSSTSYATSVPFFGRDSIFTRSTKSALRQRVVALTSDSSVLQSGPGRHFNILPATLLLTLMVVFIAFTSKPADWSHDRLMLSTVVNLERLNRINGF